MLLRLAVVLALATACKKDKGGEDTTDDTGGTDTADAGDWVPAQVVPGTYAMRIVSVTDHTCAGDLQPEQIQRVDVVPDGDYVLLMGIAPMESAPDGNALRAVGSVDRQVPATDCTLTDAIDASGTLTNPNEFTLDVTYSKSGEGADCSTLPGTLPCQDVYSAAFRRLEDEPGDDTGGGGGGDTGTPPTR